MHCKNCDKDVEPVQQNFITFSFLLCPECKKEVRGEDGKKPTLPAVLQAYLETRQKGNVLYISKNVGNLEGVRMHLQGSVDLYQHPANVVFCLPVNLPKVTMAFAMCYFDKDDVTPKELSDYVYPRLSGPCFQVDPATLEVG